MPGRWVTRRDVSGKALGEPLRCFLPHAIVAEPGLRSVDQCVQLLVEKGETCVGDEEHRLIMNHGTVVGHIDVTRERPAD